ncbi:hypothetical protein FOL46_001535, partial [Perkinsus olseni]
QNYDLVKGHNRLMAELTATAEREQNVASECIRLSHEVKHHEQQARSTEEQIQVLNDKISSMVTAEVHSRLVEEKNVALRELEDIRKKYSSLSVEYKNLSRSYAAVAGKGHGQIPRPDGTDDGSICRPLTPRPVWEDAAGVVDWQLEAAEDSDICRADDDDDHDQPQSAAGADMMHLVASVSRKSSLSLGRTLLSELERREAEGLRIMHAYGGAAALLGCRILRHYKAILEAGPPTARSGVRPFQDIAGELQPWGEALTATVLNTAVSALARELGEDGTLGLSDEEVIVMISEFATDEPPSSCRNMSLSTTSVWEFLYGVATIYASRKTHESTFVAAILKAVVKQSSIYTGSSGLLDRWNLALGECLRNPSISGTASTRTMKDTWAILQSSLWSLVLSIMFVVRREVISMTGVTPLMLAMTMLIREEITVWALVDNCHLPRDICAAFDRGAASTGPSQSPCCTKRDLFFGLQELIPWKNTNRWQDLQQYVPAGGPDTLIDYYSLFQPDKDVSFSARSVTSPLTLGLRLQHLDEHRERVDFLRSSLSRVATDGRITYGDTVAIVSANPAFSSITTELIRAAFVEGKEEQSSAMVPSKASIEIDVLLSRLLASTILPATTAG